AKKRGRHIVARRAIGTRLEGLQEQLLRSSPLATSVVYDSQIVEREYVIGRQRDRLLPGARCVVVPMLAVIENPKDALRDPIVRIHAHRVEIGILCFLQAILAHKQVSQPIASRDVGRLHFRGKQKTCFRAVGAIKRSKYVAEKNACLGERWYLPSGRARTVESAG